MRLFLVVFLLSSSLFAERFVPDSSVRNYALGQVKKERVDTFDFSGEFLELENIDIDAKRKKNVELILTGNYPALEVINYEGSFGSLSGKFTGQFPKLCAVNLLCKNCAMQLDLSAPWSRSCTIYIRGGDENVILNLPKDIGLEIHTKVAVKGKVIPSASLKKREKMGIFKKTYINSLAETAPIVLRIHVEVADGHIILND